MAEGTPPPDCEFSQGGTFHFQVSFYEDELLNNFKFVDKSETNPDHFFVEGVQIDSGGLVASTDVCYDVRYRPPKEFLEENGLLDQVLFTKIQAILVALE